VPDNLTLYERAKSANGKNQSRRSCSDLSQGKASQLETGDSRVIVESRAIAI